MMNFNIVLTYTLILITYDADLLYSRDGLPINLLYVLKVICFINLYFDINLFVLILRPNDESNREAGDNFYAFFSKIKP
jgi:hypothetical protein